MNLMFFLKKTSIVFLLLFFVISFSSVEAERSIRVRRVKSHIAPRHISLSAKSGNGIYARRYAYGRPIPNYTTRGINRRNYGGGRRRRNGNRENRSRTYANRYQNWTPNRNFAGGRNNPRVDKINQKKRKELFPIAEPNFGASKQKRRIRPHRFNPMQRPQPPKKINDFEEEYFFPEEAKRAETKYEFESRFPRPKKKRRNPGELDHKIPYYDEKPLGYKSKFREPSVSYSTFIQHSPGSQEDPEEYYEEGDSPYSKPLIRNKKKRVKKKSNTKKKNKEEEYYRPFVFENDQRHESYPPYISPDDYDLPAKTTKKRNKPAYDFIQDEDFPPNKNTYSKTRPQVSNIFSSDSDYRGGQNGVETSQFSPSYSQSWSHASVVETTARPVQYQTENGFQPQYVPNYQNRDYSSLQKTKTVTTNTQQSTYYSQPDNTYKNAYSNNYNNQVSSSSSQVPHSYSNSVYTPTTYSQPAPTYSQPTYSQPTYSQPVSSGSTLTDITIQKSVPIYDNTETFYNYNNNAYVNSQSSKYYDPDNKYGTKLTTSASSYRTKAGEKTDSDSEFIKKHQNLYNNGLSGVPIQGDGYAKENTKKDYDIGYGDFQFDENPSN